MHIINGEEYYSSKETADMLGITKCTLYRWVKRGWISSVNLPNGNLLIPKRSMDDLMLASKEEPCH